MNQKHPIDDLFRSKLVDYELPVREDLKQVFINKSKPKKNRAIPFWIFALAASFIAVLGFFWAGNKDIENSSSPVVSSNTIEAPKVATNLLSQNKEEVEKSSHNTIPPQKRTIAKIVPSNIEPQQVSTLSATGLDIMDEVIPDELTLALMESQKPKESNLNKSNKNQKDLFKKGVGETIIIIASEFEKEEEILIPEISSDSPVTLQAATAIANARNEESNSLLAKVFTNIKHLKHGEKLDLSLTSQNIYNEDTFIGNETKEIKEKIDWIKARIVKR